MKFFCSEDIIIWPDNTQCYRYELEEMNHMSDDYLVVPYGSTCYPDEDDEFVDYDSVVEWRKQVVEAAKGEGKYEVNSGELMLWMI